MDIWKDDLDIAEIIRRVHLQEGLIEQRVTREQTTSFRQIVERVEREEGNGAGGSRSK